MSEIDNAAEPEQTKTESANRDSRACAEMTELA